MRLDTLLKRSPPAFIISDISSGGLKTTAPNALSRNLRKMDGADDR